MAEIHQFPEKLSVCATILIFVVALLGGDALGLILGLFVIIGGAWWCLGYLGAKAIEEIMRDG